MMMTQCLWTTIHLVFAQNLFSASSLKFLSLGKDSAKILRIILRFSRLKFLLAR